MHVLSAAIGALGLAAAQQVGEDVVAIHEIGIAGGIRVRMLRFPAGIIAVEMLARWALGAGSVDLPGIETLAFVDIAQEIVGGRDLLELLLRGFVTRIEIRVQLLGELAIGALQLGCGGSRGHSEHLIGIVHDGLRKSWD